MTSPEPGLRERKRAATRLAIQRAAVAVVRDRGLDGATVDEIARRADISPRTFFNYFPTKEDAILGEAPTLAGNPDLEAFVADRGPVLPALARVIAHASTSILNDPELILERRSLSKVYPELVARRMANVHRLENEIAEIAARRLRAEQPDLPADEVANRARLVALTAFSFVRHAWFGWLEHPDAGAPLSDFIERAFEQGRALIASSSAPSVG